MNYADDVRDFMVAFDQPPRKTLDEVTPHDIELAGKLVDEELGELLAAYRKFRIARTTETAAEVADGAIDSIYVILWMLHKFSIPANLCFQAVHRSNMAKLVGGKFEKFPAEHPKAGKIKKPANWEAPDLAGLLKEYYAGNIVSSGDWIGHTWLEVATSDPDYIAWLEETGRLPTVLKNLEEHPRP